MTTTGCSTSILSEFNQEKKPIPWMDISDNNFKTKQTKKQQKHQKHLLIDK